MKQIQINFDRYQKPQKLAMHEWQDKCAKVCEKLDIPNDKRSQVFRWFKTRRDKVESCTRYLMENPKNNNFRYLAWMMNNL